MEEEEILVDHGNGGLKIEHACNLILEWRKEMISAALIAERSKFH
jgi:hypothetical protein